MPKNTHEGPSLSNEVGERELDFPEVEACKLFEQCQWLACFHPGIDTDVLRSEKFKKIKKAIMMLAALMLLSSLAFAAASEDVSGYPRTIVDSAGRDVVIKMPVERIIVQSGYSAEAVTALGDSGKIIGVTQTIHDRPEIYPQLKNSQVVGTWNSFDYEKIGEIAREEDRIVPNIIVLCYSYGTSSGKSYAVDSFEKGFALFQNISLIGLDFTNPENVTDSMTKLGIILGRENEAEAYNKWNEEKTSQIKESVAGMPLQKVYIESGSSMGTSDLTVYGPGSGFAGLVSLAGGMNIAGNLSGKFPKVSWEWVMYERPDVILKYKSADTLGWQAGPGKDTLDLESSRNEVLARPGADSIPAVENDRVFLCFSEMLYGLDNPVGLAYMAKLLHPEADIDPGEIWDEYQEIMGSSYPEDRIFVYPEE
jgi:iron complex transport system substrate-binding protein